MKRYKVIYFSGEKSKLSYLIQISKSGKKDGARISFYSDGRKEWQDKYKNYLLNGLEKHWWWNNPKDYIFQNWKKDKRQGIIINFI